MTYSVPDLKFDNFIIDLQPKGTEFDSDGNLVLWLEFIIHDSFHQATFSDTRVSNDDQLEQVVLCC